MFIRILMRNIKILSEIELTHFIDLCFFR